MARARTAAILVEQKAEELGVTDPPSPSEKDALPQEVETDAVKYTNPGSQGAAEVTLKGNPLKTTMEIRCGRCKLPRLLHPTDGVGARNPEPGKEYCKKRPYIKKPYFDIYGQTFVPEGPGRGKKKKDFVNPALEQAAKEGTPNGSQDSPGGSPSAEGPIKPISFPHAKCISCNNFLPVKRMNNHMLKCIGGGGRSTARDAMSKMKNGNGSNGATPPVSRSTTPIPGAKDAKSKSSPKKREAEVLESEDSPHKRKKLSLKKSSTGPSSHMLKLKAPSMMKTSSQHSASNLSFEQRASNSEDEEYEEASLEGDDDRDGEYGSSDSKKKKKKSVAKKKLMDRTGAGVKKVKSPKTGSKPILPPTRPGAKAKNGGVNGKDRDAQSESSQTLSSPN